LCSVKSEIKAKKCKFLHNCKTIDNTAVGPTVYVTWFLPRDASAERGYEIACRPSVCLSVRP